MLLNSKVQKSILSPWRPIYTKISAWLYSDTTAFSLKRLSAEASKLIQADPSQLQEVKQVSFLCHHLSTPKQANFQVYI